jgi:hypothetical protein
MLKHNDSQTSLQHTARKVSVEKKEGKRKGIILTGDYDELSSG